MPPLQITPQVLRETTKHRIIRYLLWSAIVILPILIAGLVYGKLHGDKTANTSDKQSNDTYVSQLAPTKSFSSDPSLAVKLDTNSSEIAYLKFNVSGVNGKLVKSAILSLYSLTNFKNTPVDLYLVPKVADPTKMTWSTKPDLAGAQKVGSLPDGTASAWSDIPLDQPVWTDGPIELALVGTSKNEVMFSSFESANKPKLSFDTQDQQVEALPPVITVTANPTTLVEGGSTTLSWTSTNAPRSCTASGDWSGTKQSYGEEVVANLKDAKTYNFNLICTNSSGNGIGAVQVTATTTAAAPADPGVKTMDTGGSSPTPSPTPPPPSPPPTPSPTPPPPPSGGQVVGVPYTCSGPVNNLIIRGSGADPIALINLKSGCTGSLSFDITIDDGVDGVKVQQGAHDLNITSGRIACVNGQSAGSHQDGVQVQGGTNVTFHNLTVNCPTSSGAGAFYIDGKDFSGINNVICDSCDLKHFVIPFIYTTGVAPYPDKLPAVVNSGVRNSVLHMSAYQGNQCWTHPGPTPQQPGSTAGIVNDSNSCVP